MSISVLDLGLRKLFLLDMCQGVSLGFFSLLRCWRRWGWGEYCAGFALDLLACGT